MSALCSRLLNTTGCFGSNFPRCEIRPEADIAPVGTGATRWFPFELYSRLTMRCSNIPPNMAGTNQSASMAPTPRLARAGPGQ